MYQVYILESLKHGGYYVGSCKDLRIRFTEHNRGRVRSTVFGKPWKVVYTETFDTLAEARKRERQVKNWKKRAAIERLINKNNK